MKRSLTCALAIVVSFLAAAIAASAAEPLKKLPTAGGEVAYPVEDDEATVNDGLLARVAIGHDKVTATYRNKGRKELHPRYTIRLYDRYGFLLAEETVGEHIVMFGGGVGLVEPGDVATEDLSVKWLPLERIMAKSGVKLPDDWRTVKWVVISDTNTRLAKPAAGEK